MKAVTKIKNYISVYVFIVQIINYLVINNHNK